MLSKYCKKIVDKYEIKVDDVKKSIPNLGNKTNYVVRHRNLQLYLSLGMKLTKIHRVLKFKQSDWIKKYIDFNTEKRMNAANDFEKDFSKLMINSVYRKTMENSQKIINVRLVNNEKNFLKYTSKTTYITHKFFGKDYAAIHEIKPVLILKQTNLCWIYCSRLSKWKMYGFHYNFIEKNFDAELLFTDTDSLVQKMFVKSFLSGKICLTLVIIQKIFNETNKKVIAKMKDEFDGVIVTEFLGLMSKMYSMKKIDGKEYNTAKGVSIATEFDKFIDVLFNKKIIRHRMKRIQTKKHKLGTNEIDKISLSCFDDKRYVFVDESYNLSYFHKNSVTSYNN